MYKGYSDIIFVWIRNEYICNNRYQSIQLISNRPGGFTIKTETKTETKTQTKTQTETETETESQIQTP